MGQIDLDGMEPLREQVAAIIASRIQDGTYPIGRRIPTEAALVDEFDVSRATIRAALKLLADRGLVQPQRPRGTFAVRRPEDADTTPPADQ